MWRCLKVWYRTVPSSGFSDEVNQVSKTNLQVAQVFAWGVCLL
jgi:hypothetical protein